MRLLPLSGNSLIYMVLDIYFIYGRAAPGIRCGLI